MAAAEQRAFVAIVPELRPSHELTLREWALGACIEFVFEPRKGFRGVLRHPTTQRNLQALLVTNFKNWAAKGKLQGWTGRRSYSRGWLRAMPVAQYLTEHTLSPQFARFVATRVDELVGHVLAAPARTHEARLLQQAGNDLLELPILKAREARLQQDLAAAKKHKGWLDEKGIDGALVQLEVDQLEAAIAAARKELADKPARHIPEVWRKAVEAERAAEDKRAQKHEADRKEWQRERKRKDREIEERHKALKRFRQS
jgi:hypothetical protein